ncbi:hypothetical protein HQ33_00305 [Limosilactobacillus reuteri]|nr:hypothetical protein HQ33_00305 [Limosilactobacillus reuteri]
MNKNMQKTVLTTSAVLAGMVLGVNVNQNGVHADTTTTAATTAATDTNQQLANLKSQQTANESAVASSNAATMSAATTSANSQIADLNDQIKERQASAATAQQNKIDQVNKDAQAATNTENSVYSSAVAKQKAANDAELKAAQAKVVTEQQKNQETDQENTDFQKQTSNLASEHNSNLNKINSDYQNQTDQVTSKLDDAKKADQDRYNQKVANATKQVDDQINDANNTVNQTQKTINDDQSDVNNKQSADNTAQGDVQNKQSTLNNDQNNLKQAQQKFDDLKETTDHIIVPQDYIDVWKEVVTNNIPKSELTEAEDLTLWQQNKKASAEAKALNQTFFASKQDQNTSITFNSDGTLSQNDVIIATQYAAELINPIREKIGLRPFRISNASIAMTMENASKYRAKKHNDFNDGHDGQLLNDISDEWGTSVLNESLCGNYTLARKKNLTVADLKKSIHSAVLALLFEGSDNSDNGHTTDLLGVRYLNKGILPNGYYIPGGSDFLGVTFDIDPVNKNGWIRFNSIGDGKSDLAQYRVKKGYGAKEGTDADKSIQGSNYDQIAVPNPNETAKKLQDQISHLQAKVDGDIQNLNTSKNKANETTNALKSAQDKLSNDQKTLTQVQDKLNNLKNNRDKMIHDIAGDPTQSQDVKNLQAQLNQIKSAQDNAAKAENDSYETKLNDLKKNHETKLAEIAAQPTNTDALQSQLQAKLDTLKANHDAKLKQITDDANAKIADIKSQKVNDPEIDKLQAQIDQIKSNLAKKQQELDKQYEALKTKDQNEYNALVQKLKNSSSETAKGNNDHYTTDDGSTVVKLPENKTDSAKSESDNKVITNINNTTAGLPEKGENNVNSHNGNTVRELNNSVSRGISTPTTAATSNSHANLSSADASTSTPTTREEVKQQAKLPQTGNSNSLALLALGAIASMFGFGLITKKRY